MQGKIKTAKLLRSAFHIIQKESGYSQHVQYKSKSNTLIARGLTNNPRHALKIHIPFSRLTIKVLFYTEAAAVLVNSFETEGQLD